MLRWFGDVEKLKEKRSRKQINREKIEGCRSRTENTTDVSWLGNVPCLNNGSRVLVNIGLKVAKMGTNARILMFSQYLVLRDPACR